MAVIDDDGKIRGAIGNYVYRRVNKKGVIQSHPGSLKPKGNTIIENKRFGSASEITATIYPFIKRFGLNMCYSYVYGKLVNYFKRVLFTDLVEKEKGEYLYLDESNSLAKIFQILPIAEKNENTISIEIPSIQLVSGNKKFAKGQYMEYRMQLWILNYESNNLACVYNGTSERFDMARQIEAQELKIDISLLEEDVIQKETLSELEVSMEEGLLVLCFGVQFFEHVYDTVGLNTKEVNPAGILGAWHLGGELGR